MYSKRSLLLALFTTACGQGIDGLDDTSEALTARQSIVGTCWTNPGCRRALIVSHLGDWNASVPYLSRNAFNRAVSCGAHAIEAPVRLSADGVPILAHSSPIEVYESIDCAGQRIEARTAAQLARCHLGVFTGQRFQRLDDVLAWANGQIVLELDPKVPSEVAAIVSYVRARGALDRVFFLIEQAELPGLPANGHYMLRVRDPGQSLVRAPGVFMYQLDRSFAGLDRAGVARLIQDNIHSAGLKALTPSDTSFPSVSDHVQAFNMGFDVVLSYGCTNGMSAAAQVNAARGL
jgi:hypothetical protein